MKAANTSEKKGTMYCGRANTASFLQLGGQAKELGGQLPPFQSICKRGPAGKPNDEVVTAVAAVNLIYIIMLFLY